MYLLADLEPYAITVSTLPSSPRPNTEIIPISNNSGSTWVRYTVVGACVLLALIILVFLYDLYSRYREYRDCRDQLIYDGGPPSSAGHHHRYTFAIRMEDASASFDTKQTIIRIEALDNQNRYLTSLTVPCFLFKFKSVDRAPDYPTPPLVTIEQPQAQQQQPQQKQQPQQEQQMQQTQSSTNSLPTTNTGRNWYYKSMSQLQETWTNTPKSEQITFYLVRRNPLQNLSSLRVTHDCYLPNATLFIRCIVIRDDQSQQCVKVDLLDKPIKALPPAAPSGLQVYPAEQLIGKYRFDESRTFGHLLRRVCCGPR